jgi:hypothetical protein
MKFLRSASLLLLVATMLLCVLSVAQQVADSPETQQENSVANAAKNARTKTARAKKVITDEDVVPQRGPLPALSFVDDNSDEIIEAIGVYQKTHSKEETEKVVHEWYDEYDSVLGAGVRGMHDSTARRNSTVYNGYWGCQDSPSYQNCVARRRAETRGYHDDQTANGDMSVGRIQQAFMKIRGGIMQYGLNYKWFKIRNGNGVGSF